MKKSKKGLSYKIVKMIILIILSIAIIMFVPSDRKIDFTFTGHTVFSPALPSDCSEASIKAVWDSIFIEGSSGINITANTSEIGKCSSFSAYKIKNGQELYVLIGNLPSGLTSEISAYSINYTKNFFNEPTTNLYTLRILNQINEENLTKRDISTSGSATIEYTNYFKTPISIWTIEGSLNTQIYQFSNSSLEDNFSISSRGVVFQNSSARIYLFLKTQTLGNLNCTPTWAEIRRNCNSAESLIVEFNNTNNCANFTTYPAIRYESCDYDRNGIIGNSSSVNYSGLQLEIYDGENPINLSNNFTSVRTISLREGTNRLLSFNYSFSSSLNLKNITIIKEPAGSLDGFLIVNGLDVEKTISLPRINSSSNRVCVKDAIVNNISEISLGCNLTNEYLLNCPGSNSYLSCELVNSTFIVSGLRHSAVLEFGSSIQSSANCIQNWSCGAWGACSSNQRTRTCSDLNNCNNDTNKPSQTESCVSCVSNWTCSSWGKCTSLNGTNGTQIRTCRDTNNCAISSQQKPTEVQPCKYQSSSMIYFIIVGLLVVAVIVIIVFFIMKYSKKQNPNTPNIVISAPQGYAG